MDWKSQKNMTELYRKQVGMQNDEINRTMQHFSKCPTMLFSVPLYFTLDPPPSWPVVFQAKTEILGVRITAAHICLRKSDKRPGRREVQLWWVFYWFSGLVGSRSRRSASRAAAASPRPASRARVLMLRGSAFFREVVSVCPGVAGPCEIYAPEAGRRGC